MPWSNQSGGGNGGGGGPWGQGPSGNNNRGGGNGRGPNRGQNDLEDMIRKSQERFKNSNLGGMGGGLLGLLIAAGIGAFWLFFVALYTIEPNEVGVEMVFGKPKQELSTQGLHFHFWPVETVERVRIVENQINIGGGRRDGNSAGLMLSGDQNILDVTFTVLWRVSDPAKYLFNVRFPEDTLRQVAESAMREVVGRSNAQGVFRDQRESVALEVRQIIQNTMDSYDSGVTVNALNIEDVAPPPEVADAFEEVQRAEQDEDRFREEAIRDTNQILGQARGEAAQITEEAAAYKDRIVQEARGEADRFVSVLNEYSKAKDVTRKRLYLETMEKVLSNSNKVILDEGQSGQGVVPYLPLPSLDNRVQRGN